jgi:hypothetical protein
VGGRSDALPRFRPVADDLHALGFDFHVYFNPFVYEGTQAWEETAHNGWLVRRERRAVHFTGAKFTQPGLLDLDNPDARAWAVGKMRDAMALGADGWMNDFAEWLPTDGVTAAAAFLRAAQPYPVLWQEIAREAIDGADDGGERLFFGRSGWFGTPALADVFWAGDQRTTFAIDDGLPTIIPSASASASSGSRPTDTTSPAINRHQSRLHQGAVLPLDRARRVVAGDAHPPRRTAGQGISPLELGEGPRDDRPLPPVRRAAHGARGRRPARPVTEGETKRDVYFPAGRFYPWDSGEPVVGPTTASIDAPLTEIPVFAAEGAVVPMFPDGVMTLVNGSPEVPDASSVGDDRVVRVFLGKSGTFSEAGGLGYKLEQLAPGAPTSPSFTWEGAPLAACAQPAVAPCVLVSAGRAEAHVTGPGTLEVLEAGAPSARFVASGGDAARALQLIVRW